MVTARSYSEPFRTDGNRQGSGMMLYISVYIPVKLLEVEMSSIKDFCGETLFASVTTQTKITFILTCHQTIKICLQKLGISVIQMILKAWWPNQNAAKLS